MNTAKDRLNTLASKYQRIADNYGYDNMGAIINVLDHYENDGATVESVYDDVSHGLFRQIAGVYLDKSTIDAMIDFMVTAKIITK